MRLVKCKKCGTSIMMDSYVVENMFVAMQEANEKARKIKDYSLRLTYIQEASQIKKMINQIQHRSTQMEERKTMVTCEMSEIVNYIRKNNLVSDEKLDELRKIAREKAKIKNIEEEKAIKNIYGEFENMMANRTKKDTTANKALSHL